MVYVGPDLSTVACQETKILRRISDDPNPIDGLAGRLCATSWRQDGYVKTARREFRRQEACRRAVTAVLPPSKVLADQKAQVQTLLSPDMRQPTGSYQQPCRAVGLRKHQ